MSLQVWLPLNGNLQQVGLSNATVSGGVLSIGGKIGQCYAANKNNRLVITHNIAATSEYTLSFWMKIPSAMNNATTWETAISYHAIVSSGGGVGSTNINWASYHNLKIYDDSNHQWLWAAPGSQFTYDKWHLWTLTHTAYSAGVECKIYIDGVLINTYRNAEQPLKIAPTTMYFGNNIVTDSLYFNDIRIYDHCLSLKEVQELAKCLVLHYKLDDIYIEPTTNLITTTDCLTSTCYNGATSKYGYGTSTDMYKTTGIFNGRFCTKLYMGTDGLAARPYVYISPLSVSNGTNAPAYRTLSFDYFTTVTNNVCMYKLGSGSGTTSWKITVNGITNTYTTGGGSGTADSVPVVVGEWNHIEVTFHGTTSANAEFGYLINGNYNHTSSTSNYWLFSNMQIENKDHATGYAGVNGTRSDTQVYDSSGLGYNGTIVNTLLTNSDTIRYDDSTQFSGSNYIKVTSPSTEALTISVWAKWNSIPSGQSIIYVDYKSKTGLGLMSTGILCKSTNGNSNTFSKSGIVANTWYHFVIVCPNGTANVTRQLYINGVAQSPTSNTSTWSYDIDELQIGKRSTTSDGFSGKLVDFRMYGKAFTAEEVLELYHTEASMDRGGNYYTRELME